MEIIKRRHFLKASALGGMALTIPFALRGNHYPTGSARQTTSRISLTTGDHRAEMTFQALKPFSDEIRKAIGNKRVVIKPNNVIIDRQLAASHVDTIEGILEFLKSIGVTENVMIAESAANGATFEGYDNYGYFALQKKFPVKLVDLDQEKYEIIHIFDEKDFRPHPVRTSSLILDPDTYVISSAKFKTHDRVLATLSLKNIVFGAPVKDLGFSWGPTKKTGTKNDKSIAHGGGFRGINYNLFALAPILHPDLAVIDGFEGMEGDGPNSGTPVDHRVCVAGTDWLAADRVSLALMGINFADVGYLNFCADAGMGESDLSKIEIIGEKLEDHVRIYKLNDNVEKQLIWKQPAG
jgi:uncharacterized protein (DUF362 family)